MENKKGGRYPPRMLYGIICGLKRHLEEVKGASTLNPLDYMDKRYRHVHIEVTSVCLYFNLTF